MLESEFRRKFADSFLFPPTSVIFVEPRPGIPPGQPDLCVAYKFLYIPVELKVSANPVSDLRPAQRGWFKRSAIEKRMCLLATAYPTTHNCDIARFIMLDNNLSVKASAEIPLGNLNLMEFERIVETVFVPHNETACFSVQEGL